MREDPQIKRAAFDVIGAAAAAAEALLMSSTSAQPGPQFLTGMTSAETIEKARVLFTEVRMEPVVLQKEFEGFLLDRLQYTMVADAMHQVGEGHCMAEDIDRALTSGLALR